MSERADLVEEPFPRASWRDRLRRHGGTVALFVAVVAALGPALAAPWRWYAGDAYVDAYGTQWFYWFAGEVLRGRQALAHTDFLFFPWGKEIYLHTGGNLLDAWMAFPLYAALPDPLAYNLWVLAILGGNAWAGTRLAAALGVPEGRRWTAGLALVLNPYVLVEIAFGRPTQAMLLFPGLAVATLWSMTRAREALLAGVLVALTGWTYWFHGLVLGAVAVLYGLWRALAGPDRLRSLGLHALAGAVALALALPPALPLLASVKAGEVPGLLALDGEGLLAPLALRTVEGDAEGLWVLALGKGGAGSLLDEGGLRYNPGIPSVLWVHAAVVALGLWGVGRARGAGTVAWMVAWLALVVVAASGPLFLVGEGWVVNRPWLWLVAHVDFLRRWWWPGRAVFAAHLVVAALVPFAIEAAGALVRRAGRAATAARVGVGALLLGGAVAQLLADEALPLRRWDGEASKVLRCLAAAPDGAVIDVPWASDQQNLWYQTIHGKPILGGMLVRKAAFGPEEVGKLRERNSLLRVLVAIGERQYTVPLDWEQADRLELAGLGYRYVLARKDHFVRPRPRRGGELEWVSEWSRPRRLVEKALGRGPAVEDERFALWTLDGSGVGCP